MVFPRTCAGCAQGPWPFCAACTAGLEPLGPPWCRRCGRPTTADVGRCPDCPPAPIASARAAFAYRGPAREAVHRLKFSGWRGVGEALAEALVARGPPPAHAGTGGPRPGRRRGERRWGQAPAAPPAGAGGPPGARAGPPARVRSGAGPGSGARSTTAPPLGRVRASSVGRGFAGEAVAGGAVRGDRRRLRAGARPTTTADAPARGRRVDHRGDRHRVRGGARRRRRTHGPPLDGVSLVRRSAADISRVAAPRSRCLYSGACSRPGLWLPGEPPR